MDIKLTMVSYSVSKRSLVNPGFFSFRICQTRSRRRRRRTLLNLNISIPFVRFHYRPRKSCEKKKRILVGGLSFMNSIITDDLLELAISLDALDSFGCSIQLDFDVAGRALVVTLLT